MHIPDNWVLLKFTCNGEIIYKVFAGWHGNYLEGDSWKLNSGINKIEEDGEYYLFHGYSGSVYRCHKASYGMNYFMVEIFKSFERDITIEVLPNNLKFLNLL